MSRNAWNPRKHFYRGVMFKMNTTHITGVLNLFQTDKEINAYNLHYL